jgi:glycosyltransferase involved in cell wall biosynthesis
MDTPAVTVCIFTHNGAPRLAGLLSALARQTLACHQWEVLVLDLASTDDTSAVARRHLLGKLGGRGRVVRVEISGQAWARARAAREASGEIICFLEDHHRPAPDFLVAAVQAFADRPWAGVLGGQILPRSETQPVPPAATVAPPGLGLRDLSETSQCLADGDGGVPGAGLCVRRSVLLRLASSPAPEMAAGHRSGTRVIQSGDLGITVTARQMGWQCWYVPALKLHHLLETADLNQPGRHQPRPPIGHLATAFRPIAWLKRVASYCHKQFLRNRTHPIIAGKV